MTVEEMTDVIMRTSYNKTDITRRTRLLREYLEQVFYAGADVDMVKTLLAHQATTDDIEVFLAWGDTFFKSFNKDNMYKVIARIEELVKKMPSIPLYIPYIPVPAEAIKIGKWFRRNVGDKILIDLHTDPTLLGGCAFVWQGTYRDYSLRHYMMKRRKQIQEVINDYVKRYYDK
jgi:hypothetical protein